MSRYGSREPWNSQMIFRAAILRVAATASIPAQRLFLLMAAQAARPDPSSTMVAGSGTGVTGVGGFSGGGNGPPLPGTIGTMGNIGTPGALGPIGGTTTTGGKGGNGGRVATFSHGGIPHNSGGPSLGRSAIRVSTGVSKASGGGSFFNVGVLGSSEMRLPHRVRA